MERMNEGEEASAAGVTTSGQSIQEALQELAAAETKAKEQELVREQALAKVAVQDADVNLVAAEFELDKARALRVLRENDGDLQKAISSLIKPTASS